MPCPPVTTTRSWIIAGLEAVTVTPGSTAPVASLAVPTRRPRSSCAPAGTASASAIPRIANLVNRLGISHLPVNEELRPFLSKGAASIGTTRKPAQALRLQRVRRGLGAAWLDAKLGRRTRLGAAPHREKDGQPEDFQRQERERAPERNEPGGQVRGRRARGSGPRPRSRRERRWRNERLVRAPPGPPP